LVLGAALAVPSAVSAAPAVTNVFPASGSTVRSLGQFEVYFSGPVKGVDAADLLVGGAPATNLIVKPGGALTFQFAPPPSGPVTISWAANPDIADYASSPGVFPATDVWSFTVSTNLAYPDLVITELCAGNRTGLVDEDGLASDWLEIHNRSGSLANLADWSLSDDPANPGQWVFPARTLAPGGRLVVFASSKDIRAPSGANRFHTSFNLDAGGGFLGLYTPESPRALRSGLAYPEQRNDCSWGPDAADKLGYFAVPTPGAPNPTGSLSNLTQKVHFSVPRGFFTLPFDLVLTTPTPGATIRYTTNGAEPAAGSGVVYAGPLRITNSAVVRAAAFATNAAPSVVTTHTYLFNQGADIRSLPVLSLVTSTSNLTGPNGVTGISVSNYVNGIWTPLSSSDYNNNLEFGRAWERPVSAEYIKEFGTGGFQADCGLRINGSDFTRPRYTSASKFSYRLYFRSDYGPGQLDYPLFPTTSRRQFETIVLRAGHNDISNPFIKDELNRRLHADMGQPAAQGTFVNLFINGVYKGYYNPCERVDEESLEAWNAGGQSWDRITIYSAVQEGDNASWTELINLLSPTQNAANPATYQDATQRLDVVNFIDYLLVEIYAANWDWPNNNWRAARQRAPGSLWRFYAWDMEGTYTPSQRPPTVDMWTTTNRFNLNSSNEIPTFQRWLTNSAEYRLLFADRIQRHFFNGGALTDKNITNRFLEMKSVLAGEIPSMSSYVITDWVPQRRAPLFTQFLQYGLYSSNAPVFSQHGGRVGRGFGLAMSKPLAGAIYYTTNGTDPRTAFTGAVAAEAFAYTTGVVLNASTTVKARSLNGGQWSPLTEAEFEVASLGIPLRVTEMNYNPPGGSAYEFLELYNAGTIALDLSGMFFSGGIAYTFPARSSLPPGATLVLANDSAPAAFAARYPGVTVFGFFGGSLNNGGERLALSDAEGKLVLTVDYDDEGGWPAAPEVFGPTLEIADPLGSPDDPANWHVSAANYGTPGVVTPSPVVPAVRLNEVMAENLGAVVNGTNFPDWVELFNAGPAVADLSGWSLSDDGNPRKFVFPANVMLPAGGCLVVWCDTNSAAPGLHAGFGLDRDGDMLQLFNAQTQRVDAVSFGPQVANYSLGRLGVDWVLCLPTTNAANSAAALASLTNVVINEWLANPPSGLPDWFELHNRGAQPVALRGGYLATSNDVQQITVPTFIPPGGFLRFLASQAVGFNHVDFKLAAAGDALALYDPLANLLDRVAFNAQSENVSRGRWPDGSGSFTNFVGTASPGASNYVISWTGPVFSEILARRFAFANAEFLELFNPAATNFDLGGMSLSVDRPQPGRWLFPSGTVLTPGSMIVVWCDTNRPVSFVTGDFNLGEALDADSGGAYLFNAVGQLVHFVEYGPQVTDKSIGLSSNQWLLLSSPTPGAANSAPQSLATNAALRLNEWLAGNTNGPDWFELYNVTNQPIELSGLYLTDDPSTVGLTKFRIAPLSFIGASSWIRFVVDSEPEQGRHHVNFSLSGDGEGLWCVRSNAAGVSILDTISFGLQTAGVSQGRYPDGAALIASFPGSASPGYGNYFVGPPQLLALPVTSYVRIGSNAVLSVTAAGMSPITCQWRFNGVLLPGETNATLFRTNFQMVNDGLYEVTVTNPFGSSTASASLLVAAQPVIVQAPLSQTVAPGERFTLSAAISGGPPPFSYEWRLVTTPFATNVSNQTNDFISLTAPGVVGQQLYRVVVRNPAFTNGAPSSFATITVVADSDGDGLPDAWELAYGFPANSPANRNLDSDGDGMTDYEEYLAGTNPNNAASVLRLGAGLEGGTPVLGFSSVSNRTYSLQGASTLPAGWKSLTSYLARPTNGASRFALPNSETNRFFRLVTPAHP
jgi:hypothetical protein